MRVAIVQFAPKLGRVEDNLQAHEQHLQQLAAEDVDLVVFPELSLTGYFLRDLVPDVAIKTDSETFESLAQLSVGKTVVVGFVHESRDHRFYNAAAIFSDGTLAGIHHKLYLPTYGMFDEHRYWAAGRRLRSFDTRVGKIAVLICEDVWHMSLVALLQLHRPDYAVFIANSPLREPVADPPRSLDNWYVLNRVAALSLQAPVVFANRAGCEEGVTFSGGSAFFGPDGLLRSRARLLDEDVLIVEYDERETRSVRTATPLLRDEDPWLTYRELRRILRGYDE